jgi:uncharacterized protein (UPF0548 family)/predicted DCC family thiol-disulfide oxidoreductase YuxK
MVPDRLEPPASTGAVLIFDGDCGFCTTVARWGARRFHEGERAEASQFLDDDFLARHGLDRDDVRDAAWWVDDRGSRARGHRAMGEALVAGGGAWRLLGRLALTPPTSWLAAAVYRLVVRWRYRLPGGTPACRVGAAPPTATPRRLRLVRPASAPAMARVLADAESSAPTYEAVGATLQSLTPPGYHTVHRRAAVGRGPEDFRRATEGLQTWQAHRLVGLQVHPEGVVPQVGATVVVTVGVGAVAIAAPCRVVAVVDEPTRVGFAYGTLAGHPEQGEEAFVVHLADDGAVLFDVVAFSRPGSVLTRLAGPIGRGVQSIAVGAYLRALHRYVDARAGAALSAAA